KCQKKINMSVSKSAILEALKNVQEPDLKKDIVSLNLVNILSVEGTNLHVEVKVSNPAMHAKQRMIEAVKFAIQRVLGGEFEVKVDVKSLAGEEREGELRRVLPGVKHLVAVASGKGGVGKSTVSVNLAVGLSRKGYKVGYFDADIYGPSAPTMFDVLLEKPRLVEDESGAKVMVPVESYGVKVMSIGFFTDRDQAIVWRGSMANKALLQMINDVNWGELDYLILDLPPGTGDIHLSIVQSIPLDAAIIVSTPQEVALADARKGIAMFQLPAINIPILGLVENMSWFTPEELPNNKYFLFGCEGTRQLADQLNLPLLGEIPLIQSIREAGDVGRPSALQEGTLVSSIWSDFLVNFEKEMRLLPFRKNQPKQHVNQE
ncbi:MAG: Mrp/NBP35 family ATP-binding protein, partial [Bacteroidota bacterium]